MSKPYSSDLRERVVAYVEAGHSRRAAAAHFAVSPSFTVKLMARVGPTASSAPAAGRRQADALPGFLDRLLDVHETD